MNVLRTFTAALLSMALLACGGSDPMTPVNLPMARVEAWWPVLDLKQSYAIRDDAQWQRVWTAHEPQTWPATERPQVDFSKSMVLGLSLGWGPSGCDGMSIRRVIEEQRELRVEYMSSPRTTTPPEILVCTTALVPLTDFVVVPRSDKSVYFVQVGT